LPPVSRWGKKAAKDRWKVASAKNLGKPSPKKPRPREFTKVVFDRGEKVGKAAAPTIHCVRVTTMAWFYVCDRWMNSASSLRHQGQFSKNMPFSFKIWTPVSANAPGRGRCDAGGSCSSVEFSRDPGEKYMFIINEIDEEIDVADPRHWAGPRQFRRPGIRSGEFMHAHTMALDSKGQHLMSANPSTDAACKSLSCE